MKSKTLIVHASIALVISFLELIFSFLPAFHPIGFVYALLVIISCVVMILVAKKSEGRDGYFLFPGS